MALSSDEAVFGGYENASKKYNTEYQTQEGTYDNRPNSFQVTSVHRALCRLLATASCGIENSEGLENQACHRLPAVLWTHI